MSMKHDTCAGHLITNLDIQNRAAYLDNCTCGTTPGKDEESPTLRDLFAMSALTGLVSLHASNGARIFRVPELGPEAYKIADSMMEARKK